MSVSKDPKRGTYYVQCRYKDWAGESKKKTKRGFKTEKEARQWEYEFMKRMEGAPTMLFSEFYEVYAEDTKMRLRRTTRETKANMIENKILPFLGHKRVNKITALDILNWENELMAMRTSNGLEYSQTYLHSICNQLSAMLNHAVRYYGLESNPMAKVGKIGSKQADEMSFWTKDEYLRFSREVMDKPQSFIAFELLYWCGLRLGEMLALTPADFDFKSNRLSVTKSCQRMHGEDVITALKTPKSVRTIVMPSFLVNEVIDFMKCIPDLREFDRLVPATKSFLHHEMDRGAKAAKVKRIRIHDLRHSHVSLLIELEYSPLAIADRLGHESTEVTMRYAHLFSNKQEDMADDLEVQRGTGMSSFDAVKPMNLSRDKE